MSDRPLDQEPLSTENRSQINGEQIKNIDLKNSDLLNNFNLKELSPEMLNIIRRYLYVASSSWETKLTENCSLIIKKRMESEKNFNQLKKKVKENNQQQPQGQKAQESPVDDRKKVNQNPNHRYEFQLNNNTPACKEQHLTCTNSNTNINKQGSYNNNCLGVAGVDVRKSNSISKHLSMEYISNMDPIDTKAFIPLEHRKQDQNYQNYYLVTNGRGAEAENGLKISTPLQNVEYFKVKKEKLPQLESQIRKSQQGELLQNQFQPGTSMNSNITDLNAEICKGRSPLSMHEKVKSSQRSEQDELQKIGIEKKNAIRKRRQHKQQHYGSIGKQIQQQQVQPQIYPTSVISLINDPFTTPVQQIMNHLKIQKQYKEANMITSDFKLLTRQCKIMPFHQAQCQAAQIQLNNSINNTNKINTIAETQEVQEQAQKVLSAINQQSKNSQQQQQSEFGEDRLSPRFSLEKPFTDKFQQPLQDVDKERDLSQQTQQKTPQQPQQQQAVVKKSFQIKKVTIKKEDQVVQNLSKGYAVMVESQQINNPDKFTKEQIFALKYAAYRDFHSIINFSNNLFVNIPQEKSTPIYKAFVGMGNNHILIRMVIKQRWWWIMADSKDQEGLNLLWTQIKKTDFLESMKSLAKNNPNNNTSQISSQLSTDNGGSCSNIPLSASPSLQPNSSLQQTVNQNNNSINNNLVALETPKSEQNYFSNDDSSDQSDPESMRNNNSQNILGKTLPNMRSKSKKKPRPINSNSAQQILQTFYYKDEEEGKTAELLQLNSSPIQYNSKNSQQLRKLMNNIDNLLLQGELSNRKSKKLTDLCFTDKQSIANLKKHVEVNEYIDSTAQKMHNHIEYNFVLGNKKLLFYNMRSYYESMNKHVFDYLPLTFHIQEGTKDQEFQKFLQYFNEKQEKIESIDKQIEQEIQNSPDKRSKLKRPNNIWIIKPGENTNRGTGIKVLNELGQINGVLDSNELHKNGMKKTYIVQEYIDKPLLYCKRKFDIRCFTLFTSINGYLKGYWYQEGYIRTSSFEFTIKNLDKKFIHLTNDAVQKKNENYGKFERGNKISYEEFNKYLIQNYPEHDFFQEIYPKIKEIATDTLKAAYLKIDPMRRENTFEIFGLDFMIDENFKVWLIEVNTNPCLELSSALLSKILPAMVDNCFKYFQKLVIDPIFPPPQFTNAKKMIHDSFLENNKYELVFDEQQDGNMLKHLIKEQNINWDMVDQIEEEEEEDEVEERQNE